MTNEDLKASLSDSEILFLTLVGECRGEPVEGQIAVANVIINRSKNRLLSVKEICLQERQFSCWNLNDPNRVILEELAKEFAYGNNPVHRYEQLWWITEGILTDRVKDNTKGRDHYLTSVLYNSEKRPGWTRLPKTDPIQIGRHTFLNV